MKLTINILICYFILLVSMTGSAEYLPDMREHWHKKRIEKLTNYVFAQNRKYAAKSKRIKRISYKTAQEIVLINYLVNKNNLAGTLAQIEIESGFYPYARSYKINARGLGQIRFKFWHDKLDYINTKKDLYDITKNIRAMRDINTFLLSKSRQNLIVAFDLYSGGANNYFKKYMAAYHRILNVGYGEKR